MKTVII